MHDYDGLTVSCPAAGVDSPKHTSVWRRLGVVAAFLLFGLLVAASPASAAPTPIVTPSTDVPPIGRWVSGGAEVDVPQIFGSAKWYSDRENEPVEVECIDGAMGTKVRGYFGSGDGLVTGRTSAKNVAIRGWTPQECGILDSTTFTW
jgi:hypothetical protein